MTTEEKAKLYDEALEKARKLLYIARCNHDEDRVWSLIDMFLELEESEDEKIRKWCINLIKTTCDYDSPTSRKEVDDAIAWLEKQGEQKPVDKVEPKFYEGDIIKPKDGGHEPWQIIQVDMFDKQYRVKDGHIIHFSQENDYELVEQKPVDKVESKFKVGDWVINKESKEVFYIRKNLANAYKIADIEGNDYYIHHCIFDEDYDIWTIQDAKNGDVLACNEEILIFKSYSVQGRISLYCWYNGHTHNFHTKEVVNTLMTTRNKICPATKEQRETLLYAMAHAGYNFDFEHKELKKIV